MPCVESSNLLIHREALKMGYESPNHNQLITRWFLPGRHASPRHSSSSAGGISALPRDGPISSPLQLFSVQYIYRLPLERLLSHSPEFGALSFSLSHHKLKPSEKPRLSLVLFCACRNLPPLRSYPNRPLGFRPAAPTTSRLSLLPKPSPSAPSLTS